MKVHRANDPPASSSDSVPESELDTVRDLRGVHPLGRELFAWARGQSQASQELLYRAAASALGVGLSDQQAVAVEAARACEAATGLSISRPVYKHWLAEEEVKHPGRWPLVGHMDKAFTGRWRAVRAALAGEPPDPCPDVKATVLMTVGSKLADDELIAGVREWWNGSDKTQSAFRAYVAWAKERMAKEGLAGGRFGLSPVTFITRFGGWYEAIERAGFLSELTPAQIRIVRRHRDTFTDEQLLDTVREAASYIRRWGRRINRASFDDARHAMEAEGEERGEVRIVPAGTQIHDRFGSLIDAFRLAGVITPEEALDRKRRISRSLSLAELRAWVRRGWAELASKVDGDSERLEDRHWIGWRKSELPRSNKPIPSALTLRRRFQVESFAEVVAIALSDDDQRAGEAS